MKLACSTVFICFNYYSTSFSNKDFSSFYNSNEKPRLLRNDIPTKFKIRMPHLIIVQIYELSPTALQHPHVVHETMHSGKKWCSTLWLNAIKSGKK